METINKGKSRGIPDYDSPKQRPCERYFVKNRVATFKASQRNLERLKMIYEAKLRFLRTFGTMYSNKQDLVSSMNHYKRVIASCNFLLRLEESEVRM